MQRTPARCVRIFAFALLASCAGGSTLLASVGEAQTRGAVQTVRFASGATLATAKHVCLHPSRPTNCPNGAMLYGVPSFVTDWSADLSAIPGAKWIWRPDTNVGIVGDLATFRATKSVMVPGTPVSASITIAVDDFARVIVNGTSVGTWGSTTDIPTASFANNNTTTFDITALVHAGLNSIVVEAQNGPAFFAIGCGPCTYRSNPAGVVFGGAVSYRP